MSIEELYHIYIQNPSVQTDTRKLKKGDIFFALKGDNFNGNSFATSAIQAGAAYAVIDEKAYKLPGDQYILVNNVLETLQALANHHRQQLNIPFFAITGSNGKTTTKELIHAVLSKSFKTYTTEGNLNNHIGVPLTLLKIKQDAEMAVIEMGANHIGEIASYCKIADPTHGLITNCGKAHLEGFGGVEGVKKGKGELFDYLREKGGTVFIMSDYDYLHEMTKGIDHIVEYGTNKGEVVGNIIPGNSFLNVSFERGFSNEIHTQLVGQYNLPNVLAAVAVGKFFNVDELDIKQAIETYSPSNSRSQMMKKGNNTIILDAYNANPSSMKAAIENFASLSGEQNNKYLVLGAMAELGSDSIKEHKELLSIINKYPWKEVLLVGGDFLNLEHPYHSFTTAKDAGSWLKNNKIDNAFLLLKGSRSIQMEGVLDYL